jgi:hypothetical protein
MRVTCAAVMRIGISLTLQLSYCLHTLAATSMAPDQYLGWLALALTPVLGARMAGELRRAMGSSDAIFNASSPNWNPTALTAAAAQAINTHQPVSAAKELAQTTGIRQLTWDEPEYRSACVRIMTRPSPVSARKHYTSESPSDFDRRIASS